MRALSLAALVLLCALAARAQDAAQVARKIELAQQALDDWQIDEAAGIAAELEAALPDVPPVQAIVGAVKFHQGDYEGAVRLLERAAEGGELPPLLPLAKSTRDETKGFVTKASDHFVVRTPPGKDELLADIALWALERSYQHVSAAFDYRPRHKIPVDILHDARGLASVSTLTVQEIETSGTIALCKFNRLMVTSPKALARGYSWLDTLSHEFVHLVISEKSRNSVPIWLHEGLAKYSESLWRDGVPGLALDPASEGLLARALKKKKLITFEQMHPSMAKLPSQEDTALAFAEVFTVIEYLHKEQSKGTSYSATNRLLDELAAGKPMDTALHAALGTNLSGLQRSWQRYLEKRPFKRTAALHNKRLKFVKDPRGKGRSADDDEAEAALQGAQDREARRFVRLANLLRQRGRLRAAVVEYEKAKQRATELGPALSNRLAGLYLELADAEKAKQTLEQALAGYPDDPQTHVLLARIALRAQDPAKARAHYERATYENPFNPEIWIGLFRVAELTRDDALLAKAKKNVELLSSHAKRHAEGEGALQGDAPFGTLSVSSEPWGQVWIDGEATGSVTPLPDLKLSPGAHRVRVEDPASGKMESAEVLVREGEPARLSLTLRAVTPAEREELLSLEHPRGSDDVDDGKKTVPAGQLLAE